MQVASLSDSVFPLEVYMLQPLGDVHSLPLPKALACMLMMITWSLPCSDVWAFALDARSFSGISVSSVTRSSAS